MTADQTMQVASSNNVLTHLVITAINKIDYTATAKLTQHALTLVFQNNTQPQLTIPMTAVINCMQSSDKVAKSMINLEYIPADSTTSTRRLVLTFFGFDSQQLNQTKALWKNQLAAIGDNNKKKKAAQQQQQEQERQHQQQSASTTPTSIKQEPSPAAFHPHLTRSGVPTAAPLTHQVLTARATLLASDDRLKIVHRKLVEGGIISEEEFWEQHSDLLSSSSLLLQQQQEQQEVGLSSTLPRFLVDLNSSQQGKFALTAEMRHAIFLQQPDVKMAFDKLVPVRMSAVQFFETYFAVKAAQEGKRTTTTVKTSDETTRMFTTTIEAEKELQRQRLRRENECSDWIEPTSRSIKSTLVAASIDPAVDLTAADATAAIERADVDRRQQTSTIIAEKQATLLKKFNQHGRWLVASQNKKQHETMTSVETTTDTEATAAKESQLQKTYHQQLAQSIALEDLTEEKQLDYNELHIAQQPAKPTTAAATSLTNNTTTSDDTIAALTASAASFVDAVHSHPFTSTAQFTLSPAKDCISVLTELTHSSRGLNAAVVASESQSNTSQTQHQPSVFSDPTVAHPNHSNHCRINERLIYATKHDQRDHVIPVEFETQLMSQTLTVTELLRHFWSCFPMNDARKSKLERVKAAIDDCYKVLLDMRNFLQQTGDEHLTVMLQPLVQCCEKAHFQYRQCNNTNSLIQHR